MKAKILAGGEKMPSAWIVTNNQKNKSLPSDRGRKSIKNGKVYLKNGQDFEIELYNPLQNCVLCDIKLNGQSISKTGLILKPGQRVYLDCFIDDKRKFVFNTYDVDNTQDNLDSISQNGTLEVFFYKEEVVTIDNWPIVLNPIVIRTYPSYPWYKPYPIYYGTTTGNTYNYSSRTVGTAGLTSELYTANDLQVFSTNADCTIETGRVEKGDVSNQQFSEMDMNFQKFYISHTLIQILPESRKPIEAVDLKKEEVNFCHQCGNKNDSYNFCPKCGSKLK